MSRKRCHRRRQDLDANPVRLALLGKHHPVSDADLRLLRTRELLALADFEAGAPTAAGWQSLNLARCIAESLALAGVGPEALPYALAAHDALARCLSDGRPVPMSPADLDAVRELIDLHDSQRRMASRVEFEKAVWAVCGKR